MRSTNDKAGEHPLRPIIIPKPLAVSRYEITFDEWDACHADGGCATRPYDRGWGRGRRPVINILANDAEQYLTWLSKTTGHVYRLPSEAEWEYAARAGSKTAFFWGDKMILGRANCRQCGTEWSGIKTAPVGSFKANSWGLHDVHGNVLEYVADCWSSDARNGAACKSKVVKGGAWYYLAKLSRSSSRARNDVRVFSYLIGFRAFRELD